MGKIRHVHVGVDYFLIVILLGLILILLLTIWLNLIISIHIDTFYTGIRVKIKKFYEIT